MRATLRERLFSRLIIDQEAGCVVWTGSKTPDGYGMIRRGQNMIPVHRLMYEMFAGPIPEGFQIDHLCRNRGCANVAHLEAVTHAENTLRGFGSPAVNARKTHCDHGHEFSAENTWVDPRGRRICRACKRAGGREYMRAKRARQPSGVGRNDETGIGEWTDADLAFLRGERETPGD